MLKTREILLLGLFIIAVCAAATFIPFSNVVSKTYYVEGAETISGNIKGNNNVTPTPTPTSTSTNGITTAPKLPLTINNNTDFIILIVQFLSTSPDKDKDRIAIYNAQGLISKLNTQNAATLLGEMSNPNNLNNPRLFLQYMNWFASHCPLDSNTCTGLC
jgi:hypothetical protein